MKKASLTTGLSILKYDRLSATPAPEAAAPIAYPDRPADRNRRGDIERRRHISRPRTFRPAAAPVANAAAGNRLGHRTIELCQCIRDRHPVRGRRRRALGRGKRHPGNHQQRNQKAPHQSLSRESDSVVKSSSLGHDFEEITANTFIPCSLTNCAVPVAHG